MKTTFTPGPWTAKHFISGNTNFSRKIVDRLGEHIAHVCDFKDDSLAESVANAHLLAAAPELRHALNMMLREHDALQMAEGRTDDRWPAATLAREILNKLEG